MKFIQSPIMRCLMLLLALVLCLGSFGCANPNDTPNPDDGSTPGGDLEQEALALVENGTSAFTIMRSDYASSLYTNLSLEIQRAIESVSGAKLPLATDYETKDSDNTALYEILLGETNRPESAAAKEELTENDQYLIRISGNKIILIGNSDEAITEAVTYFLATYVGYRSAQDFTAAASLSLTAGDHKDVWINPDIIPDDGKPDVLYGLSQDQVDEYFADILDGLFTGKTTETITTTGIGKGFGFHFPDMVFVNGEYWAYYITYKTDTGKGGVGLATSTDGVNWTDKGCVIQPTEDFDCNGAYFAGVWLDTDGTFYLAYECKGASDYITGELENVALATSTDGIHWDKEGVILFSDRENSWWQKANVGTPDLYKDGDTWYLFFHGFDFTDCRVGVAYGEDLHNLTVVKEPIINTEDDTLWSGTIGRRDVIYCDGYYYMVYEISTDQAPSGGYGNAEWTHMFARSRDLITWETTQAPLLTQGKTGFGYDGTCWMIVGKHLYVYMRQGGSTTAVELTLSK